MLEWNGDGASEFALQVVNPAMTRAASVQLWFPPEGTRDPEPVGAAVSLASGASHTFALVNDPPMSQTSLLRTGGLYRLSSDLPVGAAMTGVRTEGVNASASGSLLLPERSFQGDFVIPSFPAAYAYQPSYFVVIALEDDTELTWTPPQATFGNDAPIPPVADGATGSVLLNRFDNLRVAATVQNDAAQPTGDLSGTVIRASRPVAVFSGVAAAAVPADAFTNDHLSEQALPLSFWGTRSVAAAPASRGPNERHYWRVYAGADATSVSATPPVTGSPFTLVRRGDFVDFDVGPGTHVVLDGDRPFLAVGYTQSHNTDPSIPTSGHLASGDGAMVQLVAEAQWLDRYRFVVPDGFGDDVVQVVRPVGADDVRLDGVAVTGWEVASGFEVANVATSPGVHSATSADAFALTIYAHGNDQTVLDRRSLALPGGARAEELFVP
jgi:hypothetical protein